MCFLQEPHFRIFFRQLRLEAFDLLAESGFVRCRDLVSVVQQLPSPTREQVWRYTQLLTDGLLGCVGVARKLNRLPLELVAEASSLVRFA